MTIATILAERDRDVVTVAADARMTDAIALLADQRIGAMPVLRDGRLAGILSERDILNRLASEGAGLLDRTVEEMMTADVIVVARTLPIMTALGLMTKRRIRHLPVVENGRLIGIVSIGDLVKKRLDRIEAEAMAMRDYIQGA